MNFWNNLLYQAQNRNIGELNNFNLLGARTPKGLNRRAKSTSHMSEEGEP